MKKLLFIAIFYLTVSAAVAQVPANDLCSGAITILQDGTCINGTNLNATDNWLNLVGCQTTAGNHNDVFYTFVSNGTAANIVVNAGTMTGNVEVVLATGSCAGGFIVQGSQCGASPLNANFSGLTVGTQYFITVSNPPSATNGTFSICLTTSTPVLTNAQNCNNAAIICNSSAYSLALSNAGFGSQEVTTSNSCWGNGGERQSRWFKFTIGCSGVLNFAINPVVSTDDYDWAIWDITNDPTGCTTKGNSIACNWTGCTGSTGLSSCPASEPGVQNCNTASGGDPCGAGNFPRAFRNWSAGGATCLSSVLNVTAGNTYAMLVDNYTTSNNGFTLTFGGACGGGTAHIGPDATFTTSGTSCGGMVFTKTCSTTHSTYLWQFGDGATSTAVNPTHVYTTGGSYVATLTVTDALGCSDTYGVPVVVNIPVAGTSFGNSTSVCNGGTSNIPLTSNLPNTNFTWTVSQSGVTGASNGSGNTIAQTLSLTGAAAGVVTYTIIATAASCSSTPFVLTVTVFPIPSMTSGTSTTVCSGTPLNFPLNASLPSSFTWITTDNTNTSGESTTLQISNSINNNINNNVATPQTLTYTVTPISTAGNCSGSTQSVTVTVNPQPNVTSASSATICSSGTVSIPLTSDVTSTFTWVASDNPNTSGETTSMQSTATLTDIITNNTTVSQTVTYTVTPTATVFGNCLGNVQVVSVIVNPTTTANAGGNATMCSSGTFTLSGAFGGGATSSIWTTSGTGTFDNALLTNATYTPSSADIAAGSVILTITTNDPPGPCGLAFDTMILTINPAATATAGADATICGGDTYTLSGSIGLPAVSLTWTTSGTGAFDNASLANATYTPSAADIAAGNVALTITTDNPSGPCPAVSDVMILNINPAATVNAGADASICQGNAYTLSGSIGGSATSLTWTTSGSGTFSNPASATAIYTPSASDIIAGSVTLTITTNNPLGICSAVSDDVVLTITPSDDASFAYSASTYCRTSPNPTPTINGLGGGTFSFSPSGLSINSSTGTINLLSSAVGTYFIYYLTNGPCPKTDSMEVTVTTAPSATFSYNSASYCQFAVFNPLPVFSPGSSAGVFTAVPAGLVFASTITGEVDLTSSVPGTYTVTNTIAAANGCAQSIATTSLVINSAATADAGADVAICSGTVYTLSGSIGGGANSLIWSTSGTGFFNNSSLANAIYTPSAADIAAGNVTLTLTASEPSGFCPATDVMILTINQAVTVNAGTNTLICSGSTVNLSGSFGGGATSAIWTSSGTGTFDDATLSNAVYTPSSSDINAGSVTLTFTTNDPVGSCNSSSDAMILTINQLPVASAGADATICSSSNFTASATIGGATSSITWSTSGTGTFNNPNLTSAIYTLSAADILAGSVYLIVTTDNPAGPCSAIKDSMLLTINPAPTVNAGANASICEGGAYVLSGTFGGGATSVFWTSSGSGTFDNATLPGATYTPSAADIAAGTVTLTITSDDPAGVCNSVTDFMILTINHPPTAFAGIDNDICSGDTYTLSGSIGGGATSLTWTTSGSGTFNNAAIANATYTPSAGDITAGNVQLIITTNDPTGPCVASSDTMLLTIHLAATANPGDNDVICAGSTYTLAGSIGGSATSLLWSTSGSGTFNDPTIVNPVYTPSSSDISAGSVLLTLMTNDPAGPCSAASEGIILTINQNATTTAGSDATICAGNTFTTTGSIGGGATSLTWTTNGTGTFNNPNLANAVYTPSATDISIGNVTLTITTDNPVGPCSEVWDAMVLTINSPAIANANNNDAICAGSSYTLSGAVSGSATSGTWTSSGTGTFNNANLLNATYTPSVSDVTSGSVTLTLTTNDPAGVCNPVSDAMVLTITPGAFANAGSNASICANATYSLSGSFGGGATSITLTTLGTGSFSNPNTPNAIYTPSAADIAAGSVQLILTTNDPPGACLSASDTMQLTINPLQNAAFSYSSSTYCITGTNPTPIITGVQGGTFFFTPSGIVINPSTGTINLGSSNVGTFTITYATPGPCPNTSVQTVTLTSAPSATFSYIPAAYCQNAAGNASPTFPLGSSAGTFSATPTGISFLNVNTGAVDLTNSSPGIYTVTNTIAAIGGCAASSATNTITIGAQATVTAGADATICSGTPITLNGAIGGSASFSTWTTSGSGTFNNANVPTATYTPSAADIANGSVTLTITTDNPSGPCPSVTDAMQLTIQQAATANAGPDATMCADTPYLLSGSIGGVATSLTWATSGSGIFDNSTLPNASYTPSAADITAGTVTLTLTTNDPAGSCAAATDAIVLLISAPATANAGVNDTICSGDVVSLSGNIGGAASTLTWTTSGSGTFSNPGIATATYTPSAADMAAGNVTLTITTNDPPGTCSAATNSILLTINPFNDASFSYPSSTFCETGPDPTPVINGTVGGVFTASPAGLTINAASGTISLAASSPGTYQITNHTPGPCDDSATVTITITTSFSANFSYASGLYCQNGSPNPAPNFIGTGSGGIFTAVPGGLGINSVSGVVDLTSAFPGTYIVTNTIAASGGCAAAVDTSVITITAHDDASFSYSGTSFCKTGPNQLPTITGLAGGTFTVTPSTLTINSATGEVTLSSSTVGSYNITYTTNGICPFATTVPFTVTAAPDASFQYASGGVFCINQLPNPTPIVPGVGGIFSASPAGLAINSITGQINLLGSTPGTYTVTDSIPASGGCAYAVTTQSVTINTLDNAGFTYPQANYCQGGTNPTPTITGATGGTFTVTPSGLTINAVTGIIDLSASVISAYTVTYTTAGACSNSSSQPINITAPPTADAGPTANINCSGVVALMGSGTSGGNYSWTTGNGNLVSGGNTLNPLVSSAGTYTLTVTDGLTGCSASDTVTVTNTSQVIAGFTTTPNPAVGTVPLSVAFNNTSSNATGYIWSFCNGCPGSVSTDTSYTYTTSGTYTVILIATNGTCTDTATIKVIVNDAYSLVTPNIFTPNDDGINDIFTVDTKGVTSLTCTIFDRWGLKMYEWTTINGGWDGRTLSGVKAAEGTYFFMVQLKDDYGNEYSEKGSFMLTR